MNICTKCGKEYDDFPIGNECIVCEGEVRVEEVGKKTETKNAKSKKK